MMYPLKVIWCVFHMQLTRFKCILWISSCGRCRVTICKLIAYITTIYMLNFRSEWTITVNYDRLLLPFQSVNQIWHFYLFNPFSLVWNYFRFEPFHFGFMLMKNKTKFYEINGFANQSVLKMNTINLSLTHVFYRKSREMSKYYDWKADYIFKQFNSCNYDFGSVFQFE